MKKSNYLTVARGPERFSFRFRILPVRLFGYSKMGADRRARPEYLLSGLCGGFTFERLSNERSQAISTEKRNVKAEKD